MFVLSASLWGDKRGREGGGGVRALRFIAIPFVLLFHALLLPIMLITSEHCVFVDTFAKPPWCLSCNWLFYEMFVVGRWDTLLLEARSITSTAEAFSAQFAPQGTWASTFVLHQIHFFLFEHE